MERWSKLMILSVLGACLGLAALAGQPQRSLSLSKGPIGPPAAGPAVRPCPDDGDMVPNPTKGPQATIVRKDYLRPLPEAPVADSGVMLATTLWDQPPADSIAQISQILPDQPSYSAYGADDFTNAVPWTVTTIFVPGATFTSLYNATSFTWSIYPLSGPTPPGYPGGGDAPFWTLTLPIGDPQVSITNGTFLGSPEDVTLNLTTPISLPPGDWWFEFAPTMNAGDFQYIWYWQSSATSNGATAEWINPGGSFGYGTNWVPSTGLSFPFDDFAFRLEGSEGPPCDVVPVADPGFENGPPPSSGWTEWADTICEWIMEPSGSWGIPAHSGTYCFWTGGYCGGIPTTSYVEQSVTLPASSDLQLTFWAVYYRLDADDPADPDTFYVSVDGTPVFTKDMVVANNTYPGWVQEVVDLTAYSGQTVTLRIGINSLGSLTGNAMVDDVEISSCGGCSTITLDPATLPPILAGVPFSQMITAAGGTGPYTFEVTGGALPDGLTLDPGGLLSGTPLYSGAYSFTVTATDAGDCTGEITYEGTALKFYFLDDYYRSKFCVDTVTGLYVWNITSGPENGTVLTGTANVFNQGAKATSFPGDPNGSFSVLYDPVRHKATGWLITAAGHYVPLTDRNTLDNPGACDEESVPED